MVEVDTWVPVPPALATAPVPPVEMTVPPGPPYEMVWYWPGPPPTLVTVVPPLELTTLLFPFTLVVLPPVEATPELPATHRTSRLSYIGSKSGV